MTERKKVEVNGIEFDVSTEKLAGWHVFQLLKQARQNTNDYEQIDAVMEIVTYITGLTVDEFVDMCGGEDMPITDIMQTATALIMEAYPKN